MMKTTLRTIWTALQLALLAAASVLATELIYAHAVLDSPVRLEASIVGLYAAVFAVTGLAAGVASAVLRRPGAASLLVGAGLTFLVLALRLHDLADLWTASATIDGGLALFTVAVAASVAWIAGSIGEGMPRRAAATVLLAAYVPALVLAAKLLVNTSAIPLDHPTPVALALVLAWPLLLTLLYRLTVRSAVASTRLVAVSWFVPLAIVAASALGGPSRSAEGAVARPTIARPDAPPIIWVTIDTLRADHLSVYGYPVRTTPRLEEFARTATVYTACGSQAPSTWQSVPSLLSGLTPYRHGGVSETRRLSQDLLLLPEVLQKQGYETIGESANPWVSARYGMTQGFDEFHLYNTDDELMLYDFMKLAMRLDPWDVFRLRDWLPSYAYVPFGTLVNDAADTLKARRSQAPLFLYLQPVDPHGPYQAPLHYVAGEGAGFTRADYVSYWALKTGVRLSPRQHDGLVALYDGAITYTDAELGRLFDRLRELDLFDRSLIIVTADHGEQFYDHGLWRHSNSLYQALLHVPLLVKYPNQHAPNVVDEPVASIDIMPTILRALGQGCPTCEGHPLQEAGRASAPPRFAYLMGHNEVKPVIRCVVAEGWKLILADKEGLPREQLFRLDADPTEANDQRAAHPEVATRLAALLDGYEAAAGPTVSSESIKLQPAETQRLRALGYVQ